MLVLWGTWAVSSFVDLSLPRVHAIHLLPAISPEPLKNPLKRPRRLSPCLFKWIQVKWIWNPAYFSFRTWLLPQSLWTAQLVPPAWPLHWMGGRGTGSPLAVFIGPIQAPAEDRHRLTKCFCRRKQMTSALGHGFYLPFTRLADGFLIPPWVHWMSHLLPILRLDLLDSSLPLICLCFPSSFGSWIPGSLLLGNIFYVCLCKPVVWPDPSYNQQESWSCNASVQAQREGLMFCAIDPSCCFQFCG